MLRALNGINSSTEEGIAAEILWMSLLLSYCIISTVENTFMKVVTIASVNNTNTLEFVDTVDDAGVVAGWSTGEQRVRAVETRVGGEH